VISDSIEGKQVGGAVSGLLWVYGVTSFLQAAAGSRACWRGS
jgi:hypothetical protein